MKVALIHDHLAQDGGAEKVLKALVDIYPSAPIYTLLCDQKNVDKYFKDRHIETSIIQKLPGGIKHYQWYMPFMPMAVEFFDLRSFDVVISDASAFAKGVITSPQTLHVCYCHTPTRYIWDYTHQYINELNFNKFFKKIISLVLNYIRMWDRLAADRVDLFVANSRTVQNRIRKYYKRESVIIYPPVDTDRFYVSPEAKEYYLIGGRLAPYKRVDIVVEAFRQSGKKLKIFGDGVDLARLMQLAGKAANIEFLGRVNEEEKAALYSRAIAFINPQEEDFGITVVEAMASGRPVIAFNKGGATETIIEGITGVFFDDQTAASLNEAIARMAKIEFDPQIIREHAQKYDIAKFRQAIIEYVESEYSKFNR